jgi:hypothetical protein
MLYSHHMRWCKRNQPLWQCANIPRAYTPLLSLHSPGARELAVLFTLGPLCNSTRGSSSCLFSAFSRSLAAHRECIFPFCRKLLLLRLLDFYFLISQLCGHSRNKEMAPRQLCVQSKAERMHMREKEMRLNRLLPHTGEAFSNVHNSCSRNNILVLLCVPASHKRAHSVCGK